MGQLPTAPPTPPRPPLPLRGGAYVQSHKHWTPEPTQKLKLTGRAEEKLRTIYSTNLNSPEISKMAGSWQKVRLRSKSAWLEYNVNWTKCLQYFLKSYHSVWARSVKAPVRKLTFFAGKPLKRRVKINLAPKVVVFCGYAMDASISVSRRPVGRRSVGSLQAIVRFDPLITSKTGRNSWSDNPAKQPITVERQTDKSSSALHSNWI